MNATKRPAARVLRSISIDTPSLHAQSRPSLSDRRTSLRGVGQTKARLTIVDGPSAGQTFDIVARDQAHTGLSFLLRTELRVGQACTVEIDPGGRRSTLCPAEITRARTLSTGRYEISLQYRRQTDTVKA